MKRTIRIAALAAACLAFAGCARECCHTEPTELAQEAVTYRVQLPAGKSRMPVETKALKAELEKALERQGIAGDSGWTVRPRIIENPEKTGRLAVDASIFAPDGTPAGDFYVRCWDASHWSSCRTAVADEIAETLVHEAQNAQR